MPAPAPPTDAEREARARFVETKNDVALLIEVSNRGLAFDGGDGFENMLADLAEQAPKLGAAAGRLRHNLPVRADCALPDPMPPPSEALVFCIVWPDGEVFTGQASTWWGAAHKFAALRTMRAARQRYPELRLYDARDKTFIDPEEGP